MFLETMIPKTTSRLTVTTLIYPRWRKRRLNWLFHSMQADLL